jgi:hypothetical protein
MGRVAVGEMWVTGSSWEGFCWIDVGHRFGSGELLLETCVWQVQMRRVVIGEMWAG